MSVAYPVPVNQKMALRYIISAKPYLRYVVPAVQAYATKAFATVALFRYALRREVEIPVDPSEIANSLKEYHDYHIKPLTGAELELTVHEGFSRVSGSIRKTNTTYYDITIPEAVEFDGELYRRLVEAQTAEWGVWADRVSKLSDDEIRQIFMAAADGYARFLGGRYPEHYRAIIKQRLNILSVDPQYYRQSLQAAKDKWARGLIDRVSKVAMRSREISQPAVAAAYQFTLTYINAF